MKKIPQTAIFHVIVIKEKVPTWRQGVALDTDRKPVLNAADCLKFSLKFFQALWMVRIEPLACNSSEHIYEPYPIIYCSLKFSVIILIHMKCHIHVKNHKLWW